MRYKVPEKRKMFKRPCQIFSYLTVEMMADLEKLSDQLEMSVSTLIRWLVKDKIKKELSRSK